MERTWGPGFGIVSLAVQCFLPRHFPADSARLSEGVTTRRRVPKQKRDRRNNPGDKIHAERPFEPAVRAGALGLPRQLQRMTKALACVCAVQQVCLVSCLMSGLPWRSCTTALAFGFRKTTTTRLIHSPFGQHINAASALCTASRAGFCGGRSTRVEVAGGGGVQGLSLQRGPKYDLGKPP